MSLENIPSWMMREAKNLDLSTVMLTTLFALALDINQQKYTTKHTIKIRIMEREE